MGYMWKISGLLVGMIISISIFTEVAKQYAEQAASGAVQSASQYSNNLYVALGDSVASGSGLTPADTSGCSRSLEAYPEVLAKKRGYEVVQLACGGATIEDGIFNPQVANGQVASQLDQLRALRPGLMTLGVGANDSGWLYKAFDCSYRPCGTPEDREAYRQFLETNYIPSLTRVLQTIDKTYGDEARLLVIGYYQVLPPSGVACDDTAGFTNEGLAWGRDVRAGLNRAMSDTVKETGIGEFISVDFTGHELCSEQPWIQRLTEPAPYHANQAGQSVIADRIDRYLNHKEER